MGPLIFYHWANTVSASFLTFDSVWLRCGLLQDMVGDDSQEPVRQVQHRRGGGGWGRRRLVSSESAHERRPQSGLQVALGRLRNLRTQVQQRVVAIWQICRFIDVLLLLRNDHSKFLNALTVNERQWRLEIILVVDGRFALRHPAAVAVEAVQLLQLLLLSSSSSGQEWVVGALARAGALVHELVVVVLEREVPLAHPSPGGGGRGHVDGAPRIVLVLLRSVLGHDHALQGRHAQARAHSCRCERGKRSETLKIYL